MPRKVIVSSRMPVSSEIPPPSLVLYREHIHTARRLESPILFRSVYFSLPQLLPLYLVHKVEVGLVKVVNADITVLTTRGICGTCWVDVNGVEGPEVTTHTPDLVFENFVVEASLEFTLASGGCSDIHRGLATTKNHVIFLRRDSGGIEWCVGRVGFENGQITSRQKLCAISLNDH